MANTRMVEYAANGGAGSGYLALPDGTGPFGAVVVIQEWWGLDAHIKALAERLAGDGFVALAPDLYHGAVAAEPDEARKLMMLLDMPHVIKDMVGAVNYLCGRADVRAIGTVGFCMGGSLALALAGSTPRVGPVAAFYGGRQLDDAQLRRIGGPVLAVYGEQDQGIPPVARQHLDDVLTGEGIPHEIVVYPGAGHAFMNDTRAHAYNAAAAADAWQRMTAFFKANLEQQ